MNQEKLWAEFSTLSPQAQKLVLEFIALMQRSRYLVQAGLSSDASLPKLTEEEFVGMWRDREDLEDSSAWVRQAQQNV